jgi:hypothetical protein
MNRTGQNGEKARYKVVLFLVLGLTVFSSAMKELNNLQQFASDASHLIAQVSEKLAPAQVPQIPQITEIQHTAIKVETCELQQSLPSVELPWMSNAVKATDKKPRAVGPRPSQIIDFKQDIPLPSEIQIAKLKKLPQIDFDQSVLELRIGSGAEANALIISETPKTQVKTRSCKDREIRNSPRDREMLLKTLNRSINLRIAS